MTVLLVFLLLGCGAFVLWIINDPEYLRSQAEAEIEMYAARRSREAEELKHAMRRDSQRLRDEFDDELRDLDEW